MRKEDFYASHLSFTHFLNMEHVISNAIQDIDSELRDISLKVPKLLWEK